MIGLSLLQATVNPPPSTDFEVRISPSSLTKSVSNGSYTSPYFSVSCINGVGPFVFEFGHRPELTINIVSNTDRVIIFNFTVSGANESMLIPILCLCTDQGDGDNVAGVPLPINLTFL